MDNIVLEGEGERFHGKWALEDKILTAGLKEWQNSMLSLKKSTEFISMIEDALSDISLTPLMMPRSVPNKVNMGCLKLKLF